MSMIRRTLSPADQLLERVQTWLGVRIEHEVPVRSVAVQGHTIARFPSEETLEVALSGTIRRQIVEDPDELPAGVWPWQGNDALLIDLTQPKGMEEAIRVLLNAYILAQDPSGRNWWLKDEILSEDPYCEQAASQLAEHRSRLAEYGSSA